MEAEDRVSHLRNDLNCSICLDVFANPLTLPCGHSFCQKCIHEHWDREETMSCFTCPECRFPFSQRPEPQKNVSLSKVVECVTALDRSRALVPIVQSDTSAHNSAPTLCQRHHQDLILYCSSDNRCICCKCLLTSCRQHEVQDIQELSHEEKKKLSNDLLASDHQQKHMEEDIEKWKCKMKDIKDFHEMMVSGILAKFDQVHKALDESQVLVIESVNCAKNAAATQASEHILLLQRHLEDLKKYEIEAKVMLGNDDVAFLEGLHQLTPVVGAPGSPNVQLCGNLQMEAVTTVLSEASRLLQQELPNLLHPEIPIDKLEETLEIPSAIAVNYTSLSEQKTPIHRAPTRISALRAQLCKDYHNLKFDSETASRYIAISHENCKATHKLQLRRNNVQDSPNRFQTWQVMCTEGFSEGSHYWESCLPNCGNSYSRDLLYSKHIT
ncbi:E3 ubiquitin-protein ligase TRIM65 isoform X2 [Rhinoderma darwinii]|uniref:E3 ubiquitin-protein ligase TRIM65 isoform X2 n=1 Tax=Rhinoderma darwinii TaxID=43563 RepID=UPI003F666D24